MIRQVIDGYQPGTVKPTDPKQWGARISPCVNVVGTYEDIVDAYSDAINRGDASFQIRIRKVWECYDRRFAPACFCGDSEVLMESGTHKLVRHLAVGDSVKVSGGDSAQVTAVWRAQVDRSVPRAHTVPPPSSTVVPPSPRLGLWLSTARGLVEPPRIL